MVRALSGRFLFVRVTLSPMSNATDLWGQDISLDSSGQARVAASGELILTEDVDTGVQDIRLRLFTRLGSLFYDREFGSRVYDWIMEESTEQTRAAFVSEVVRCIEGDPRVVIGGVSCAVAKWDERELYAVASWRFVDVDHPLNLVLQANKAVKELVINDVDHEKLTPAF